MSTDIMSARPATRYAALAETLHRIADDLAGLDNTDVTDPFLHLAIQPADLTEDDDRKTREVDAVGRAVLGRPGTTERLSGGTFHHGVRGYRDSVHISVYNSVTDSAHRQPNAELTRLRAALDEDADSSGGSGGAR